MISSISENQLKLEHFFRQVVSRFAAASLEDEAEKSGATLNDSTTIELPWILRKVFEWLLDHHEVQSSGARLR